MLLARCRIGCQIAVLALLGLVGMAQIAGISWWGSWQIEQRDAALMMTRDGRDTEQSLQMALLNARRYEKDFLLRHNDTASTLHAQAMRAAGRSLDILTTGFADQPGLADRLRQIQSGIRDDTAAFEDVLKTAHAVGLDETQGLLGELRTTVHDVEQRLGSVQVPAASIAMLMMRRHEKDFMARLDPAYGAQLRARLPEFRAAIEAADLTDDFRRDVMSKITAYQDTFARFMAGKLEEQKDVARLSAIFAGIEPRLTELDEIFGEMARESERQGEVAIAHTHRIMVLSLAVIAVVVAGFSWAVGRGIARPIIAVTRAMQGLIEGDLDTSVPPAGRRDEIGTMIDAIRLFRNSLIEAARVQAMQEAAQAQAEVDKRQALLHMAETIESSTAASVDQIRDRAAAMMNTAADMRGMADRTGASAQAASGAASVALGNAQTVASAAEELAASIRAISGQVTQSSSVVAKAVAAGNETRAKIEMLNEQVGRIGAVADIIGDIAGRTNLLALNATIEAARAGEAGKGFAVVASEVKQLANQTARSTEEITRHISEVRNATTGAVAAVERIAATISEVDQIAGSIADAIEQQGAATAEISRNVTETAAAVNEMAGRNTDVAQEAAQAGEFAGAVLENSTVLQVSVVELQEAMVRIVRSSTAEVQRRVLDRQIEMA